MADSEKHRRFVAEPMREKPVTKLAGIGEVLGNKLRDDGFHRAYAVLGQYLLFGKDERKFKDWLHRIAEANAEQQTDCHRCLKEWCDQFL